MDILGPVLLVLVVLLAAAAAQHLLSSPDRVQRRSVRRGRGDEAPSTIPPTGFSS